MTPSEFAVNILSSAAVSAALTAALFWLLRNWISERLKNAIKHEYDTKLESHKTALVAAMNADIETLKARLQADNTIATERLKADLQIAAMERQIRFARLHEKVAEIVAEMYKRLSVFTSSVTLYTSIFESKGMGSKEERRLKMAEALKDFDDYFRTHKLYLPKSLADRAIA